MYKILKKSNLLVICLLFFFLNVSFIFSECEGCPTPIQQVVGDILNGNMNSSSLTIVELEAIINDPQQFQIVINNFEKFRLDAKRFGQRTFLNGDGNSINEFVQAYIGQYPKDTPSSIAVIQRVEEIAEMLSEINCNSANDQTGCWVGKYKLVEYAMGVYLNNFLFLNYMLFPNGMMRIYLFSHVIDIYRCPNCEISNNITYIVIFNDFTYIDNIILSVNETTGYIYNPLNITHNLNSSSGKIKQINENEMELSFLDAEEMIVNNNIFFIKNVSNIELLYPYEERFILNKGSNINFINKTMYVDKVDKIIFGDDNISFYNVSGFMAVLNESNIYVYFNDSDLIRYNDINYTNLTNSSFNFFNHLIKSANLTSTINDNFLVIPTNYLDTINTPNITLLLDKNESVIINIGVNNISLDTNDSVNFNYGNISFNSRIYFDSIYLFPLIISEDDKIKIIFPDGKYVIGDQINISFEDEKTYIRISDELFIIDDIFMLDDSLIEDSFFYFSDELELISDGGIIYIKDTINIPLSDSFLVGNSQDGFIFYNESISFIGEIPSYLIIYEDENEFNNHENNFFEAKNGMFKFISSYFNEYINALNYSNGTIGKKGLVCVYLESGNAYYYNEDLFKDYSVFSNENYDVCFRKEITYSLDYNCNLCGRIDYIDKSIFLEGSLNYLRYPYRNNSISALSMDVLYSGFVDSRANMTFDDDFFMVLNISLDKNYVDDVSYTTPSFSFIRLFEASYVLDVHRLLYIDNTKKNDNHFVDYRTSFSIYNTSFYNRKMIHEHNGSFIMVFPQDSLEGIFVLSMIP
jgi:hypothetical protein